MNPVNKHISIALCTYNGEAFLKEQLESISMQTTAPYELVICDDGSTDATKDILSLFAAKANFPVKLRFNKANLGFIKNFEQAISLCNGDIIALSDQDDIWHPKKLQVILQSFSNPNVSMAFSNATLINAQGQLIPGSRWDLSHFNEEQQQVFARDTAYKIFYKSNKVSGCTMAFLKKWWPLIHPLPHNMPLIHDGWIALISSLFGEVVMIEEPLIKYRLHVGQTSTLFRQQRKDKKLSQNRTSTRILKLQQISHLLETVKKRISAYEKHIPQEKQKYLLEHINDEQQHIELRLDILQGNRVGLRRIVNELKSGRYHRYRRGLGSALDDFRKQYIRTPQ